LISFIFIAIFIIGIGISGSFIYKNIFDTIGQTDIMILSNAPSTEVINFIKYEKVKNAWEEKNDSDMLKVEKDPFNLPIIIDTETQTE